MSEASVRKIKTASALWPGSWPIAAKLSAVLVAASLIPMLLISYYTLQQGLDIATATESQKLEQLAANKGAQIDQLIKDTKHTIAYFGWSEEVIRLAGQANQKNRAQVQDKMLRLMTANENIELFMVLSKTGQVLASSKPEYLGRMLDFRDYFKEAVLGHEYISDLSVGTASNKPGMYFSAPVRNAKGLVAGVSVLKMRVDEISAILSDARSRGERETFLVDSDGIIIHHPDQRVLYHSLAPLPAEVQKKLLEDKRFGLNVSTIPSFNLNALAEKMASARQPEHFAYRAPISQEQKIVGFSPLAEKRWLVAVSESEDVYSRPLRRLFANAVQSVVFIGLIFIGLALLFARTFTRPLKALTNSAKAVENDDLDNALVKITTRDEIGRFAITFNHMVASIQARQRERDIFGRMVSPEVREKLLKGDLKLGGDNLRVSVLFSDIRGFSTLSEKMSPQDVVALLNEYLTEMTEAVRPWGGYVNNFIGDAIVVIFGAPESRSECEWSAVNAALAMKQRLEQLNIRRAHMGDAPIKTGIGISTGKVVAGQIGSLDRFMYTVIGDAVNVAARLEALTKEFEGNPILMNAVTYEGCKHKEGEIQITDKGLQTVKGRQEPVHVYAVYSEAEATVKKE